MAGTPFNENFLIERLRSETPEERRLAAKELGRNAPRVEKKKGVAGVLCRTLDHDAWEPVQEWSAWALGQLRQRSSVPALMRNLQDDNRDVRVHCALALGAIGDNRAVPALLRFLEDEEDELCSRYALQALGCFKQEKRVIQRLKKAATDPKEPLPIRREATSALAGMHVDKHIVRNHEVYQAQFPGILPIQPPPVDLPLTIRPKKPRKLIITTRPERDTALAERVKKAHNWSCQVCGSEGFDTKGGGMYAEVHHIIPLQQWGLDTADNMLVVCPNCHKKLHYAKRVKWCPDAYDDRPSTVTINDEQYTIKWLCSE